jgi:hypothetical protein
MDFELEPITVALIMGIISIIVLWIIRPWLKPKLFKMAIPPEEKEKVSTEDYDLVDFSAFAPTNLKPNTRFVLEVWAYLRSNYKLVLSTIDELERGRRVGTRTSVPVFRESLITLEVSIPSFGKRIWKDNFFWHGEPVNATFDILVPRSVEEGNHIGTVKINYEGIPITQLIFSLDISQHGDVDKITDVTSDLKRYRTAFASYASQNREEVFSRLQGMKKIAPYLDVFVDVLSLRSGDNWQEKLIEHVPTKDIFFLFWSTFAAESVWVEREWRLALDKRGVDYIDPIPLEPPSLVSPPEELKALHFNDAYLLYIYSARTEREYQDILGHAESEVRSVAAEALGTFGDSRAIDNLIRLLYDRDMEVRFQASNALYQIGDDAVNALKDSGPNAVQVLVDIELADTIIDARNGWLLAKIGEPAVKPLIKAYQYTRKGSWQYNRITGVLKSIGSPEALDSIRIRESR